MGVRVLGGRGVGCLCGATGCIYCIWGYWVVIVFQVGVRGACNVYRVRVMVL